MKLQLFGLLTVLCFTGCTRSFLAEMASPEYAYEAMLARKAATGEKYWVDQHQTYLKRQEQIRNSPAHYAKFKAHKAAGGTADYVDLDGNLREYPETETVTYAVPVYIVNP